MKQIDCSIKIFNKLYYILSKKSYIERINFLKKDNSKFELLMDIIAFHGRYNTKAINYKHIVIILEIKTNCLELCNKLITCIKKE